MNNTELLVSQLPAMNDYLHATSVYWKASRHPENIHEILTIGKQTQEEFSLRERALLVGTTAITLVQQLPLNEMLVGLGVGATLKATGGNVPASIAVAGAITGTAELSSGIGMAHCLDKFRPAVDIMSDRYIDKKKIAEKAEKREAQGKKPSTELGRTYAAASIVLTSGATIYEDLRDRSRTIEDNLRTAKIASAMVVANYCAVSAIVVGGAGAAESMGVEGSLDTLQTVISNPMIMGAIVGGVFAIAKLKERRSIVKELNKTIPKKSSFKVRVYNVFGKKQEITDVVIQSTEEAV